MLAPNTTNSNAYIGSKNFNRVRASKRSALALSKYLNNIVEQDRRAIKRVTRAMLGFKSFRAAAQILAGIELMHMIRKGQLHFAGSDTMSLADQLYA